MWVFYTHVERNNVPGIKSIHAWSDKKLSIKILLAIVCNGLNIE
jgi:hypothetical protein